VSYEVKYLNMFTDRHFYKSLLLTVILLSFHTQFLHAQQPSASFNLENLKNNKLVSQHEVSWLRDSLPADERNHLFAILSTLSSPAAAQLLPSDFYLDGSTSTNGIKSLMDSLAVRPPDDTAGYIRVAYLAAKLREVFLIDQRKNTHYITRFTGEQLKLPTYNPKAINKKINLNFDYEPANIIFNILSTPDIKLEEIEKRIMVHQFDMLYIHHAQSFYLYPLNKERLAACLEKASSTNPVDVLYRWINPYGLLNYTEVKNNIEGYKQLITTLSANEKNIFDYIRATISPFLPDSAHYSRKVSFFMINGSDGWGAGDVTAIDLNYFKDDYSQLIPDFAHETFHSGQSAVTVTDKQKRPENEKTFVSILVS